MKDINFLFNFGLFWATYLHGDDNTQICKLEHVRLTVYPSIVCVNEIIFLIKLFALRIYIIGKRL